MCHLWSTLSWCPYFTFLFVCEELLLEERVVDFHITSRALHGWSWLLRSVSIIYDEELEKNFANFVCDYFMQCWCISDMSILIDEISYSINALIEAIGNMHCSWHVRADKLVSFNKFRFSTVRRLIINIKGDVWTKFY